MSFAHLHVHGHHSLLDGLGSPRKYAQQIAHIGQTSWGLTDHGSLSGLYQGWKVSQELGLGFVAGSEMYVAPGGRMKKEAVYFGAPEQKSMDVGGQGAHCHLTVLARNATGLRNLFRLQAEAFSSGFYRKPRVDLGLLSEHRDGLMVLTGCAGSILCTRLRLGQDAEAREHLGQLKDIFGDSVGVEVMYHAIDEPDLNEFELNGKLVRLAQEFGLPLVGTNDSHYCVTGDADTHQALLCVNTRSTLEKPTFKFNGDHSFHLATEEEMRRKFNAAEIPLRALDKAAEFASRVESYDSVFQHQLRMPRYASADPEMELRQDATEGLGRRLGEVGEEYGQRLEYELDTITSLGFSDYFLVTADILSEARNRGIRIGPGRGSAGGSLVAYALGITDLNPIPSGLLWERFLNPQRASLPDVDTDIQEDRRDEVLAIAREKYGDDNVAQLGTFGSVGAKAALKDAARVLGEPYAVGEERSRMLPPAKFGRAPGLDEYTGPKDEIYDLASGLEGTIRSESVHAAGVVISPEPLQGLVPLRKQGGKGHWVTGQDMKEVETQGLVKMDFLGLRTLKVIDDCLRSLGDDAPELPTDVSQCDDPGTFAMLSHGEVTGTFQLESQLMRGILMDVKPESLDDISAVISLGRPGPMSAGAHKDYAKRKRGEG